MRLIAQGREGTNPLLAGPRFQTFRGAETGRGILALLFSSVPKYRDPVLPPEMGTSRLYGEWEGVWKAPLSPGE